MKRIKNIRTIWATALATTMALLVLAGCTKEDVAPTANVGDVTFVFKKNPVYSLNSLLDVASVKFVISNGTKNDTLPSMKVSGTSDSLSTPAVKLAPGTYKIVSYRIYAADASLIYEANVTKEFSFNVKVGEPTSFIIPTDVYVQISAQPLKNALLGICLEAFGPDKSTWPWKDEVSVYEWKGIEYDPDYGYITGIVLDSRFKNLKRLPGSIANIPTLDNIHITDCDIEELPDELENMNIGSIYLKNTKLKELKPSFFKQRNLYSLTIMNAPIASIPEDMGQLSSLLVLNLIDLNLTTLPSSIGNVAKLQALLLRGSKISSLPTTIGQLDKLAILDATNTQLSTLPATINDMDALRSIYLTGCKFTSFPAALKNNTALRAILLDGNPISAISAQELGVLPLLNNLDLSGTTVTNIAALNATTTPALNELALNSCGLTQAPAISALPTLISLSLQGNSITTMPAGYFPLVNGKSAVTMLYLAGNKLTTLPADFGVFNGATSLHFVDLSENPQLTWTVPQAWKAANVVVNATNTKVVK